MAIFDPSRLYISLLNTGLQQKDNPLYQVIHDLIKDTAIIGKQVDVLSASSSGGGGSGNTGPAGPQGPPGLQGLDGIDGGDNYAPIFDPNGYIPYVGANRNVDLGLHSLTVDSPTFFVDSVNHRVGIGTITPAAQFHIDSATVAGIRFSGVNNGAGQPAAILSLIDTGPGGVNWNIENGRVAGEIGFYSGSDLFTISVGSTTSNQRLAVKQAGVTQLQLQDTSIGSDWFIENGRVADALDFYHSGIKMVILGDGKVGIGTSTPGFPLAVAGDANGNVIQVGLTDPLILTGAFPGFSMNEYYDGANNRYFSNGYAALFYRDGSGALNFQTAPSGTAGAVATLTSRLIILNTGQVGISKSTPTAWLHLPQSSIAASGAPLKFTSGPLLTTPEAGTIEFLTDAFYAGITTGPARRTFAFLESPAFTGTVTGVALNFTGNIATSTGDINATAGHINAGAGTLALPSFGLGASLGFYQPFAGYIGVANVSLDTLFGPGGLTYHSSAVQFLWAVGATNTTTDLRLYRTTTKTFTIDDSTGGAAILNMIGNLGISTASPTARLQLPAGTAAANTSPLKMVAGTLLTTPEIGAIEYTDDGTTAHIYATVRVATVVTRVQLA